MRNTVVCSILVLVLAALPAGCDLPQEITGSGTIVATQYDYSGFTTVAASNACRVTLTRADNESITIRTDDNLAGYLVVVKNGTRLEIGLDPGYVYRDVTFEAAITMPDIYGLGLSGASYADVSGFDFEHEFRFDLSGASRADGDMILGLTRFYLSGASRISMAEGWGGDLLINASGGSVLELRELLSDNGDVVLSGGSSATITVSGTLAYDLSGASQLYYYGDPVVGDTALSGGSVARDMGVP